MYRHGCETKRKGQKWTEIRKEYAYRGLATDRLVRVTGKGSTGHVELNSRG